MIWDKIYKIRDSKEHVKNMSLYLGRDKKCVTSAIFAVHATVLGLSTRIGNFGQRLYMDSFFFFS
jgi:hypothetical protein